MHVQAGQAADLQKRRAPVQQTGDALARQQLIALLKLVTFGFGLGNDQTFQALHLGQQCLHTLGIGGKGVGLGLDLGTKGRHTVKSLRGNDRIRSQGDVNVNQLSYRCFY